MIQCARTKERWNYSLTLADTVMKQFETLMNC